MAIQKELWSGAIQENFYKGIEVIKQAFTDDTMFLMSGANGAKTIHVPSAGSLGSPTKGNSTYPVSITERPDQDVSYDLSNYEIGPLRLGAFDQFQLEYDKLQSITNDFMGGLGDRAAREIMIANYHYTSGKYVNTTGSAYAAHVASGTGNRKGLTGADLRKAAGIMDTQVVPQNERYLLVDSTMFWQLMDDMGYNSTRVELKAMEGFQILSTPVYGFTVITMPLVVTATAAGVVNAFGATGATTDVAVALAIQKSCGSFASTDVFSFTSEQRPEYFGDILSATLYCGGSYRRYDKKGIVPILGVS